MKSRGGRSPEGRFGLDPESKFTSALTKLGAPVFQIHTHFFFSFARVFVFLDAGQTCSWKCQEERLWLNPDTGHIINPIPPASRIVQPKLGVLELDVSRKCQSRHGLKWG